MPEVSHAQHVARVGNNETVSTQGAEELQDDGTERADLATRPHDAHGHDAGWEN